MEILDLTEKHHQTYFHCFEDWSEEMKEAGEHKEVWFHKMKEAGLRVKIAVDDEKACGLIQYMPAENSIIDGRDHYFIYCIWVHGYKKGIGNYQKKGIGKALLAAAEKDIESMGGKGAAAWGISFPFWMKAAWFKKQGYKKVDKDGMALLMWKPFMDSAVPPRWIKQKKRPKMTEGKVNVSSYINGWCPAQNIVHERAKRASREFGERVEFHEINTSERDVFCEWGISDALFIDGKKIRTGPPPTIEKIRKIIARKVKMLKSN